MTHPNYQDPRLNSPLVDVGRRQLLGGMGAAAILSACGKREDPPSATSASGAMSAPSAPVTAQPEAVESRRSVNHPDFRVGAILLPGLVNSATDGPFIELVRAMGRVYTRGQFLIEAAPVGWISNGVTRGIYDLGLPTLRLGLNQQYKLSTASFGRVNFVLYSHRSKPLTSAAVQAAMRGSGHFPYQIEAPDFKWGFPTLQFTSLESALRKVEAGRIDALLWAQEEADNELRRLGLRNIRRESYGDFDDVMLLPDSKRGVFVDSIISECIALLSRSGELQEIYARIHRPHSHWQP